MGAIVAHRAPEKDEWRSRIYNSRDPTKIKGSGRKRPGKKEKGPWNARGVGDSNPRARGPFSLGPWAI